MAELLDAYGRPVKRGELTELQAEPGVTSVRQAFQGTVASGLTPQRLAAILRACDEGRVRDFMILAEEMEERDPHYASVLGQRKRAISGVAPRVEPASESARDTTIAEAVEARILRHEGFSDLVEDCLDALGKGFAVVEIDWRRAAREWWPARFVWRPQSFFVFDRETGSELRLADIEAPVDGLALAPFKFIRHVAKVKSGSIYRGGLARVAAFGWMCKAYTLKDWVAFVETYGLPLRLGRYGPEASPKDVETLFRAVANIGTDAAAVIPRHMDIEFVDNKSGGATQPIFENLARFVDEQLSKAVLGQTMTTDDGSSRAQAEVHNDVRHDVAAADARAVTATLNRDLVQPFVDLNFGAVDAYPRLAIEIKEPEDLKLTIESVDRMAQRGVSFRSAEVRAKLGFSDPEEGDETFGGSAPAPDGAPPQAGARSRSLPRSRSGVATARADPFDELDEIEAGMLDDWEEVMDETLAPVDAILAEAGSYEEALERLDAAGLPAAKIVDALVKGMFKARALGDVQDG